MGENVALRRGWAQAITHEVGLFLEVRFDGFGALDLWIPAA